MIVQGNGQAARPLDDLSGKKVTVVGLGRFGGGVGVTKWLCATGAKVTVSDRADASELAESVRCLSGLDVQLHLGGHLEGDFLDADLLVVNPAVPKDLPLLIRSDAAGVARTSEINLFLQRCPASVVGVTGSVGKSTTAAMIGAILQTRCSTYVGGNIGGSLLDQLPRMGPHDVVVLELSSFQLEDLPIVGISPHVAVVTNLLANHLDRHGTLESYAAAKKNIFRFQGAEDVLVLNSACPASRGWADEAPGEAQLFDPLGEAFSLRVPGQHNQANAQAAWTAARQYGVPRDVAAEALERFSGLPHRLQFIAEIEGLRYYNDSKSTIPSATIAALEAFPPRTAVVIVGGYDKDAQFEALGTALKERAKAVVTMGATAGKIISILGKQYPNRMPTVHWAEDLAAATNLAAALASPGDAVLLSPACASYDMFDNYEQRGDVFAKFVASRLDRRA